MLPEIGILAFFYDCASFTWGFDPADRGSARVFFFENTDGFAPHPIPEEVAEEIPMTVAEYEAMKAKEQESIGFILTADTPAVGGEDPTTASEEAHQRMADTDHAAVTDSLRTYTERINALAQSYINGEIHSAIASDTLSRETTHSWYVERYKPQYTTVSTQITKYMTGSETTLGPDVNRLSNTARRAVTPVFISLVVMIVVVLIFYYLLHVYFTKPILRINEELGEYLRFRTPFDSSIACRDEIASLRDRIVALIQKQRK